MTFFIKFKRGLGTPKILIFKKIKPADFFENCRVCPHRRSLLFSPPDFSDDSSPDKIRICSTWMCCIFSKNPRIFWFGKIRKSLPEVNDLDLILNYSDQISVCQEGSSGKKQIFRLEISIRKKVKMPKIRVIQAILTMLKRYLKKNFLTGQKNKEPEMKISDSLFCWKKQKKFF